MTTTRLMLWAHRLGFVAIGGALALAAMLTLGRAQAQTGDTVIASEALAVARVISYQGRLLDATTNARRADGAYTMDFRLYAAASGGAPLWTETQSVPLQRGVFSTLLGNVAAFPPTLFNGQNLWLAVAVNGESEMTPRIRIAPVAYALFSDNADKLDSKDSTAFAATVHTHDGGSITTGAVTDAHIDPTIARDSEVFPIVLAEAGPGSGLDADTVDGINSTNLLKGALGVQYSGSLVLSEVQNVFTFGYSPNTPVLWFARPTTTGGKVNLVVDIERGNDGNLTYWLRVTNTGPVPTNYELVRQYIYN